MDYRAALLFLFLYYVRPQDWVAGMAGFNIVRPMILIWVAGIFSSHQRPTVTGLLRTPHDWAVLVYAVYIVWNAPSGTGAWQALLPYLVFYWLTVRSLSTWPRVLGYLKFWNLMLLVVAAMGVGSLFGVDLTGARDVTELMAGRLSLGTWLHNNPNALAHSVVVAIPLSYLLYFWRRGAGNRLLIFPAFAALAGFCVFETESKGAFLVGGVLVVLLFVVGRPRFVQFLALSLAATIGISALSFLPRMEKMGNLRSDEGVQGRLMVWEMARRVTETKPEGEGWKQFQGSIIWMGEEENKATHSSYVQVGADLGINGLFLYLLPLWLSARSLLAATSRLKDEPDKERCRRAALLLVISYAISGWMINREYHTEYFLMIAVAAAIHRLNLGEEQLLVTQPALWQASDASDEELVQEGTALAVLLRKGKRLWNRIGLADIGVGAALTWGVLFTWDYVLHNL